MKYEVSFSIGEDAFETQLEDVELAWIPAEYRDVPLTDEAGNPVTDPDTGAQLTKSEQVSGGRSETEEEALLRELRDRLVVDEFEKHGLSSASVEVSFTVYGTVTLELDEYELEGYDSEDEFTSAVLDDFSDSIYDLVMDQVRSGYAESDYNVESADVE